MINIAKNKNMTVGDTLYRQMDNTQHLNNVIYLYFIAFCDQQKNPKKMRGRAFFYFICKL